MEAEIGRRGGRTGPARPGSIFDHGGPAAVRAAAGLQLRRARSTLKPNRARATMAPRRDERGPALSCAESAARL